MAYGAGPMEGVAVGKVLLSWLDRMKWNYEGETGTLLYTQSLNLMI